MITIKNRINRLIIFSSAFLQVMPMLWFHVDLAPVNFFEQNPAKDLPDYNFDDYCSN